MPTCLESLADVELARLARVAREVVDATDWADGMLDDELVMELLHRALDRIVELADGLEARGARSRPGSWEERLLRDIRGEAA